MERKMMDAASGGAIVNRTPSAARDLISIMVVSSQQFGFRQDTPLRIVNELVVFVLLLVIQWTCPTLQEDCLEHANVVGGFLSPLKKKYDPYSNTYNPRWRDHPNFSYGARPQFQHYQPTPHIPPQQPSSSSVVNPRENVSAITLQSGKEFDISVQNPTNLAKKSQKEKAENEVTISSKVEVNIPLLDAIKQVPRYAKFLKELCTTKRRLRGDEKISVGENVSAVIQHLGASINVMPYSIYESLKLDPLKQTGVIIQLAGRSNAYHEGVVEDVLGQVNELVFPVDFYILNMEDDASPNPTPILLGRPFLKTARTNIDVHDSTLTMEFDGEIVKFNIFDDTRYPNDIQSAFSINMVNVFAHETFEFRHEGKIKVKTKAFQDRMIDRKQFVLGQKVLLYNSRLKLMPSKLRSHWIGPFEVTNVFSYGVVEVRSLGTNKVFKVNGYRFKRFHEGFQEQTADEVQLRDPTYTD
ncbi:uncharacterized protein LOC127788083 [Diospyros lotus]|uniref:uncharacterized protein LOC127788083 n=1 Tax=Diospyros lotus TaxID=55363 RepID=UPI002255D0BC|nr:uncharacterized protein LOC127788083 [Diospyros lotus]